MHNLHPMQIYTQGVNLHLGCILVMKTAFYENAPGANFIRVRICSAFQFGANLVEQINTQVHIGPRVQIAHMNTTCYHICTI